jgi:hypothetical protein
MAFVQLFAIILQGARIARQVVGAVKLHRVDENTDHHHIRAGFGFINQLHMTIMQVAHRRDQRDTLTFLTQTADMLAQQRQGFNNQHNKTP